LPCVKAGHVYTFPPWVNVIWTESYVLHKYRSGWLNAKQAACATGWFHILFYRIPFQTIHTVFQVTMIHNVMIPHNKERKELFTVYRT
jgi:hypothetical protein